LSFLAYARFCNVNLRLDYVGYPAHIYMPSLFMLVLPFEEYPTFSCSALRLETGGEKPFKERNLCLLNWYNRGG